ncbi:MAG: hypothetical protein E6J14_10680 [Chloroflexi bacterium]|nr:MAG: hypothetical protein E6J14_10680 [Chloroflexota bacterium]
MAGIVALVVAALVAPVGAVAASSPSPGPHSPRSLAVSVPADPVPLVPGDTSPIHIRVLNPGSTSVTVTVKGEGVTLGDNGTTRFTGAPDPQWAGNTDFPPDDLTVPAQGFIDVSITVHVPAHINPDLYYIGFVVTPIATASGSVIVINQIGAFFIINVPGPRDRKLAADLNVPGLNWGPIHLGSLLIGDQVVGKLTAHNVGPSSVQFFGENDATHAPFSGTPSQQRINKSLLPIRRSRSLQVTAQPAFPIDMVTMTVTLTYPDQTDVATKQIVLTKSMLVISPWVIVVVGVLLALVVCWRLYARHRRRSRRQATANSTAGPPKARSSATR